MILEGTHEGKLRAIATNAFGHLLATPGFGGIESTLEGRVFAVANQTGVTSQAGLSATTPVLTLYNPAGSGVNGLLLYAGGVHLGAFAAAAAIWLAVNTNTVAAAVTGTATTAHRATALGKQIGPRLQPLLAATLPAAPVGLCLLGVGLTGAITTVPALPTFGRAFERGEVLLTPGTAVSIQYSTASGASSCLHEFMWEEVDAA